MNCLHPVRISNRTLTLTKGTPILLTVNCGSCVNCNKRKVNDYFIRAFYEFQKCQSYGGFTYFETLTYNDKNLPISFGIPHFEKKHLRLFFQRLKGILSKNGFEITTDGKNRLRYLVSSEYGGKTRRPHYHCLLFVYIHGLDPAKFKQYVNEAWKYGFCNPIYGVQEIKGRPVSRSPYMWLVNDYKFIHYVCKYVVKQVEFEHDFKNLFDDLELNHPGEYDKKELYKKLAPFRLNSNGFGLSLLDHVTLKEKESLKIQLPYSPKGVDIFYKIPKYIERKLFMYYYTEVRDDGRKYVVWEYTPEGITHKIEHSKSNVDNLAKTLRYAAQNVARLSAQYDDEQFRPTEEATLIPTSLSECSRWLTFLDPYVDKTKLAQYILFYRGTYCPFWRISQPDLKNMVTSRYDKSYTLPIKLDYKESVNDRLSNYLNDMILEDNIRGLQFGQLFLQYYEFAMSVLQSNKAATQDWIDLQQIMLKKIAYA